MNAPVGGEFWMEGTGQARSVPDENGFVVMASQNFDIRSEFGHDWSPNEHRVEGLVESDDVDVGLERVDLATVGVASHRHRNRVEMDLIVATFLDAFGERARRCEDRLAAVETWIARAGNGTP